MKYLFLSIFLLCICVGKGTAQQSSDLVYMTGEVVSVSADNILTCKNIAGDIPGVKDSLDINKIVDLSTVFKGMSGEMTIGVAEGFLKTKTGKTATIRISKYTSKMDDQHIIKVGNKLKFGWYSPEKAKRNSQYELGNKEYKKENYEAAIEFYKSALEIDSLHGPSLIRMANSYKQLGKSSESFDYYGKALKVEPDHYQSRFDRAFLSFRLSRSFAAMMAGKMDLYATKGLEDVNVLLKASEEGKLTLAEEDKKVLYKFRIINKVILDKQNDCCADITKFLSLSYANPSENAEDEPEFQKLKQTVCSSGKLSKKATKYHQVVLNKQRGDNDTLEVVLADTMKNCTLQLVKATSLKVGDTVSLGSCERTNLIALGKVVASEAPRTFMIKIIRWNIAQKEMDKVPGMSYSLQFEEKLYCPIRSFSIKPNTRFYLYW